MLIIFSILIFLLVFIIIYIIAKQDNWIYKDDDNFEYPNFYQQVYIQYLNNDILLIDKATLISKGDIIIWKIQNKEIEDEQVIAWSHVKCKY